MVAALALLATGSLAMSAVDSARTAKKQRARGKPSFKIMTRLSERLAPGRKVQVRLYIANNRNKPVRVKRLSLNLKVDAQHAAKGCSAKRDYRVIQLPHRAFPYKLNARGRPTGATKKQRKKQRARWRRMRPKHASGLPAIKMLNLPHVNQNACRGARIKITFSTLPTKKKSAKKKAKR